MGEVEADWESNEDKESSAGNKPNQIRSMVCMLEEGQADTWAEEVATDILVEEDNVCTPHTVDEDVRGKEEEEEDLRIVLVGTGNACTLGKEGMKEEE
jgi:hypothetical protein